MDVDSGCSYGVAIDLDLEVGAGAGAFEGLGDVAERVDLTFELCGTVDLLVHLEAGDDLCGATRDGGRAHEG